MTAVAATAALTVVAAPAPPAGALEPPFTYADSSTIDVQGTPVQVDLDGSGSAYQPNPRLWDVTLKTPSIFVAGTNPPPPPAVNPVQIPFAVRIYLPAGYDHDRAAGYPVLYLLHGGDGRWSDWSRPDAGNIVDTLAGSPFPGITVMVEGGRTGWYADWHGETDGHFSPKWETFHTQQLLPWVDTNLNTIATRSGRTIAGLSMGGLGALRYAGRDTVDLFSAVGSFSGAVELRHEPAQDLFSNAMWAFGATVVEQGLWQTEYRVTTGEPPEEEETSRLEVVFGPSTAPVAPETRPGWPDGNPVELADEYNAYDGKLAIYSGDSITAGDGGEEDIVIMNNALHAALNSNGVVHRYCRGFGTHEWQYWRNDLRDFLQYVYGTTPTTCTTNAGWALVP